MTFQPTLLADEIARRAADIVDAGEKLSCEEIAARLLAEDGLTDDEDWLHPYRTIVGEVMAGEREVHRQPRD
jgi:hypothetical protein